MVGSPRVASGGVRSRAAATREMVYAMSRLMQSINGKMLLSYRTSSGKFCHPVSRRPLSHECEAPDSKEAAQSIIFSPYLAHFSIDDNIVTAEKAAEKAILLQPRKPPALHG